MEEAKRLLYEKTIRKFTMQEVTKQKNYTNKNLIELISKYPGNGEGFKVYSKWWPEGNFYHVKKADLFTSRYGRLSGVKYQNGEIARGKIEHIKFALKRGMWRYNLYDTAFTPQDVELDNGLKVNLGDLQRSIDEKHKFLEEQSKQMQVVKVPEKAKAPVKKAPSKLAAGKVVPAGGKDAKKK